MGDPSPKESWDEDTAFVTGRMKAIQLTNGTRVITCYLEHELGGVRTGTGVERVSLPPASHEDQCKFIQFESEGEIKRTCDQTRPLGLCSRTWRIRAYESMTRKGWSQSCRSLVKSSKMNM